MTTTAAVRVIDQFAFTVAYLFSCLGPSSSARQAAAAANIPHYKRQFLTKIKDLDKRQVDTDPVLRCKNPGLPRIGPLDKIVQQSKQIVFLYDDVSGALKHLVDDSRHANPR